ncbi:hypothetical protein PG994_010449 [Apiospora phragmitis]|uniref:Mitochondrial thiamine pyrophosphate carrier 1 n=1 Tax=Apiospora phragmitis TaxID=2905665 RepID=A0ABR1TPY2_9PEZI
MTASSEDAIKAAKSAANQSQFRDTISQPVVAAFCAGGVAGAVSRTVVSPLERLKILLQVQSAGHNEYKLSVGKALAKMWKEEGWRGFMAGNGTNCIRIVPYSAVQFGSYNLYKRTFFEQYPGASLSPFQRLICGGIAGVTSVFLTYPWTLPKQLPGMWPTMVAMYKQEGGVAALYRGIIPTVTGVAPYVGLNFMTYEFVRKYLTPEETRIPARFQINTMSGMGYQYKSIGDAIRVIVAQEGWRGLYKGLVPNLLKVAPSMAANWLSFEMTRDFLVGLRGEPVIL